MVEIRILFDGGWWWATIPGVKAKDGYTAAWVGSTPWIAIAGVARQFLEVS